MYRRLLCLLIVLPLLGGVTAAAQPANSRFDGITWLPAETAAVMTLNVENVSEAARALNILSLFGSFLQPLRIGEIDRQPLARYFPLAQFDIEGDPFAFIAGWSTGEMVIGYRQLDETLTAADADVVIILPTRNAFSAASALAPVLDAQDEDVTRTLYGDIPLYAGDQTVFAFTPQAVVIGEDAAVRAVLDVRTGDAPALSADARFITIAEATRAELPDAPLFLYANNETARHALPFLLGTTPESQPLLPVLAQIAVSFSGAATPLTALLNGQIDALGVRLRPDLFLIRDARAAVHLHLTEPLPETTTNTPLTSGLLDYVPRSAALVMHGDDARLATAGAFAALPLANFAPLLLGGFPAGRTPGSRGLIPLPDGDAVQDAISGFASALEARGIDIEALIGDLEGPYMAAVLPRPNDPTPTLNSAVDVVFVARATAATALVEQIVTGLEVLIDGRFVEVEVHGIETASILAGDAPVLRIAQIDDIILIGTGTAVDLAVQAQQGDNRLTTQPRWSRLVGETGLNALPDTYFDVAALLNIIDPETDLPNGVLGITGRAGESAGFYGLNAVLMIE